MEGEKNEERRENRKEKVKQEGNYENCEKRKKMKKPREDWKGERKGGEQRRAGKVGENIRGKRGGKREEGLSAKFSFPNEPIAHRTAKVERDMIALGRRGTASAQGAEGPRKE